MEDFIRLHRKIMDWQWYKHKPTMRIFIHVLIFANENGVVEEGVFNIQKLMSSLKLTRNEVNIALKNLQKTDELTVKKNGKRMSIIVNNYQKYQN